MNVNLQTVFLHVIYFSFIPNSVSVSSDLCMTENDKFERSLKCTLHNTFYAHYINNIEYILFISW